MNLKRWLAIIGGLSLLIWLAVPVVRIWRDPGLRTHHHALDSEDEKFGARIERLSPNSSKATKLTSVLIFNNHEVPYWEVYRALLAGNPLTFDDHCPEWIADLARQHGEDEFWTTGNHVRSIELLLPNLEP